MEVSWEKAASRWLGRPPAPGAELWQMHSLGGGGGRRGDANCPRAQGGTAKTANEKAETKHFLEVAIFEWLQAALPRPACAHVSVAFCSGVCTAPADGASLGVNTMPVCTSIWPVLPGPPRGKVACPLSASSREASAVRRRFSEGGAAKQNSLQRLGAGGGNLHQHIVPWLGSHHSS